MGDIGPIILQKILGPLPFIGFKKYWAHGQKVCQGPKAPPPPPHPESSLNMYCTSNNQTLLALILI